MNERHTGKILNAEKQVWKNRFEDFINWVDPSGMLQHLYFADSKSYPNSMSATDFHEYLLEVSKDKKNVLKWSDFPPEIVLNRREHILFNRMRDSSQDGFERVSILGTDLVNNKVINGKIAVGKRTHVPGKLVHDLTNEEREAGTIDDNILVIHSHPRKLWSNEIFLIKNGEMGMFSTGDLYNIASGVSSRTSSGLVDGNWNLLVFESQETQMVDFDYLPENSQTEFSKYWHSKCGYALEPHNYEKDTPGKIWRSEKDADYTRIIPEIAYHHLLVLYRGKPNRNLERVNLNDLLDS